MARTDKTLVPARSRLPLVMLGIGCELLYLLYFVGQFPLLRYYRVDIDMGGITGHSRPGFVAFVVAFTALFTLFGLAYRRVRNLDDRATLWIVLGFGCLFALTMAFVYPVTAIDIFTYVAQSWIMVHYHQNPIFMPPSQYPHDPLMPLAAGWAGYGAPYGPLGIAIDALPTLIAQGNLLANLVLLKLMFSGMALVGALLSYRILRRTGAKSPAAGALFVAWNPLLLFEISANGHNDAAMMLLLLLAVLSVVEDRLLLAVLLAVASALVKYAAVLLVPLFLIYGVTHQPTHRKRTGYLALATGASACLAIAAYVPFWRGADTFSRALLENQLHMQSFSSLVAALLSGHITVDQATLLGRVLFVPAYAYALWLPTRRPLDLLRGCFLATFFFVMLGASNFKIWYAVWPSMLAAAIPRVASRLSAFLMGYGATISAAFYGYVWVWLGLENPGSFPLVNSVSYFVAFVPAALASLGLGLWQHVPAARRTTFRTAPAPPALRSAQDDTRSGPRSG